MKKILIVVAAVLIVTGFGLSAEALTVYNTAGQVVADATAQAIGINPVVGIKAGPVNNIDINATLPCLLSVNISNSHVDWTINSVGDYRILVAKIDVTTNINSSVTMKVEGAYNLMNVNDSRYGLETYYNFRTDVAIPATSDYIFAGLGLFNGDKKITVGSGTETAYQGTAYLWNRINATAGKPAGTYSDNFTVTFSQSL